jgi:hypothetical protein
MKLLRGKVSNKKGEKTFGIQKFWILLGWRDRKVRSSFSMHSLARGYCLPFGLNDPTLPSLFTVAIVMNKLNSLKLYCFRYEKVSDEKRVRIEKVRWSKKTKKMLKCHGNWVSYSFTICMVTNHGIWLRQFPCSVVDLKISMENSLRLLVGVEYFINNKVKVKQI